MQRQTILQVLRDKSKQIILVGLGRKLIRIKYINI